METWARGTTVLALWVTPAICLFLLEIQANKQKKKTAVMLPRVVLTPLKVNGAHVESASGTCELMIAMLLLQVWDLPPSGSRFWPGWYDASRVRRQDLPPSGSGSCGGETCLGSSARPYRAPSLGLPGWS